MYRDGADRTGHDAAVHGGVASDGGDEPMSAWRRIASVAAWVAATGVLAGGLLFILAHGDTRGAAAHGVYLATWAIWMLFAAVYLREALRAPWQHALKARRQARVKDGESAYLVRPSDDPALVLRRLAREYLGDEARWVEIYARNSHRRQADGTRRWRDPAAPRVGWSIVLPEHETTFAEVFDTWEAEGREDLRLIRRTRSTTYERHTYSETTEYAQPSAPSTAASKETRPEPRKAEPPTIGPAIALGPGKPPPGADIPRHPDALDVARPATQPSPLVRTAPRVTPSPHLEAHHASLPVPRTPTGTDPPERARPLGLVPDPPPAWAARPPARFAALVADAREEGHLGDALAAAARILPETADVAAFLVGTTHVRVLLYAPSHLPAPWQAGDTRGYEWEIAARALANAVPARARRSPVRALLPVGYDREERLVFVALVPGARLAVEGDAATEYLDAIDFLFDEPPPPAWTETASALRRSPRVLELRCGAGGTEAALVFAGVYPSERDRGRDVIVRDDGRVQPFGDLVVSPAPPAYHELSVHVFGEVRASRDGEALPERVAQVLTWMAVSEAMASGAPIEVSSAQIAEVAWSGRRVDRREVSKLVRRLEESLGPRAERIGTAPSSHRPVRLRVHSVPSDLAEMSRMATREPLAAFERFGGPVLVGAGDWAPGVTTWVADVLAGIAVEAARECDDAREALAVLARAEAHIGSAHGLLDAERRRIAEAASRRG